MYALYADGSCQPNPGTGGWAYILKCPDGTELVGSGFENESTNNRMELRSVIEGLYVFKQTAPVNEQLTLILDSKYVLDGISIWSKKWVKQGWIKKNGKPVLNENLWKELIFLASNIKMKFEHVKGHTGHPENERCDKLAVQAAKRSIAKEQR
jgi:ribonuclease HI